MLSPGLLSAQGRAGESREQPDRKYQVGGRLGVWGNRGDLPPATLEDSISLLRTDIADANIYLEGFGSYRIMPRGLLEFSIGFVNRGDVNLRVSGREYFGNLVLYPILLSFKYYFASPTGSGMRPYLQVGGGLYYGRQGVQFTNDPFFAFNQDSEVTLNYVAGGGLEWPVSGSLALEFNARYMPVNFGEDLVLVQDYQAVTVTAGIVYLFSATKNPRPPRGR
jgi:hypothetical protein